MAPGCSPAFFSYKITAFFRSCGEVVKLQLKISRRSPFAGGTSAFREEGGMSPGLGAPFDRTIKFPWLLRAAANFVHRDLTKTFSRRRQRVPVLLKFNRLPVSVGFHEGIGLSFFS